VPAASITLVAVSVIRKAGVMAVVERGGEVVPGNRIVVTLPPEPHVLLAPV
jgi:MOSC domain-containing protein YiiM